jgi:hypothetical protein
MVYITIQPDVHVYRLQDGSEGQIALVSTEEIVVSQNPLNVHRTVNIVNSAEALDARNIVIPSNSYLLTPNSFSPTVFVKSNLPIDTYSDDFSVENIGGLSSEAWMRLKNQIRMTRRVGNTNYWWRTWDNPIKTNAQGEQYVPFIADTTESFNEVLLDRPWYSAVELGLEKLPLELPLAVAVAFRIRSRNVSRYTGTGEATTQTPPVNLLLTAILKTAHAVSITPPLVTLNEDNNYTSFVTVEANDGANWTFTNVDSRITVAPTSGTGRAAVIVKAADGRQQTIAFENVPLTITSTVNPADYPDIIGEYEVSGTAEVHLEQYTPTRNALIPKMDSNTSEGITITPPSNGGAQGQDAWQAFNHTL